MSNTSQTRPSNRRLKGILLLLSLMFSFSGYAADADPDAFTWAPNYEVGDTFPEFAMKDHTGTVQTNHELTQGKGYLVAFNRSVVW